MAKSIIVLCLVLVVVRCAHADTTYVSGTVTGTWTRDQSPFVVTGDITVGDTLRIEHGVQVLFQPGRMLTVLGRLEADGAETDSIIFTCAAADTGLRWDGIRFNHPTLVSFLYYCTVQRVRTVSGSDRGFGFLIDNSRVVAANCLLRDCRAGFGSAVYLRNGGRVDMTDCEMTGNGTGGGAGGGLLVDYGCTANLTRCHIAHNSTLDAAGMEVRGATVSLVDCDFDSNHANIWGGALLVEDSSDVTATGCTFHHNHGLNGGAVYASPQSREALRLTKCLFYDNEASYNGGGGFGGAVYSHGGPRIVQCTIADNRAGFGGGIYGGSGDTVNSSIIAFNMGGGFMGGAMDVHYCDIFDNAGGDTYPDSSNIHADPQFYDSVASYYLTGHSPCIDAGDPTLPHDPDGTRADMGCYYYDQSAAVSPRAPLPSSFSLAAYPNPFNSSVRLTFTLPRAGAATLTIFDVLGRETTVLMNKNLPAGEFTHLWNASSAATGVYFAVLRFGTNTIAQKLLLLK